MLIIDTSGLSMSSFPLFTYLHALSVNMVILLLYNSLKKKRGLQEKKLLRKRSLMVT